MLAAVSFVMLDMFVGITLRKMHRSKTLNPDRGLVRRHDNTNYYMLLQSFTFSHGDSYDDLLSVFA